MESSFSFKTQSLDGWRDSLRDINFWLNGYLNSDAHRSLELQKCDIPCVAWNAGVGPACCFTRAISSITREWKIRKSGPYDHVIEVDMKQAAAAAAATTLTINEKLTLEVAERLGLLNHGEYNRLMEDRDEIRYYTYGLEDRAGSLQTLFRRSMVRRINQKLSTKKYLLVVENLDEPIKPIKINDFMEGLSCIPPPNWNGSFWLVSTTSKDVYERSKRPDYGYLIESFNGDDIVILTLYSLHLAAKYIMGATGQKHEQYWHHVVVQCFQYATMLLIPHCSSPHGHGGQQNSDALANINSDELIRQWAAQGILTVDQQERHHGKYNDMQQVGHVILEAFREYSLLQLPFSDPATIKADEATRSAAHFLACHGLVAERHTTDQLCDEGNNHPRLLKRMHWISHVGDQGWHFSREWLSQAGSGPTALIARHSSQQSRLFMKLQSDHYFLARLPCLRALDLSYTPLESLPPSISCLQKLQLLSLRGCHRLTSPFSFPDTETTLHQNNGNKMHNFLYLDLSYSNVNTIQCNFFHKMPNLRELLLPTCSNLEELLPSIVALSSLTRLELTDNKNLPSPPTLTEIALDGHGALTSFSLVGVPHLKRLSLRGCTNLETVDIKEADALEELDLSCTAIKELLDYIPNLPQLRRLVLLGVPFLRRFPWHKLQRLPDVFCLDQCSDRANVNNSNPQVAQVCVSDSRLFYSFNYATRNLVRDGKLLKTFYVRVKSWKASTRKTHGEEDNRTADRLEVSLRAYADVSRHNQIEGALMVPMDDVPPFWETERHVEISEVDQYPHGLKNLLEVTKSISMSDDTHVSGLSLISAFDELEECKLERCHQMSQVFSYVWYLSRTLRNTFVSHLRSVIRFIGPSSRYFFALKHLCLQHCPRLEGVLPRACRLPSLVTLDILFCYNLKAIFYQDDDNAILAAPAWEELHVRGCWSLRRLPRLHQQPDNKAVKVSGERAWWAKLRWDDDKDNDDGAPSHRGSYEPRLPPASASVRERVVIKSYLR
ncbi:hypothetical protein BS78_06G079200 [Paspalum vaginatum]|nr:hypothetical protein BS78_06G079200 [Paspalum vaginatum]